MWDLLLLFLDLPPLHCGQAGSKAALCFFLPPNIAILSDNLESGRKKERNNEWFNRRTSSL